MGEKLNKESESDAEQKKKEQTKKKEKKKELSRAKPQSTQPCWNDQIDLSVDILSIRDSRPQCVCVCEPECVCVKARGRACDAICQEMFVLRLSTKKC